MFANCNFIMIGDGQYLTDHHNRENEMLIYANPSFSKDNIIADFVQSVWWDKIPKTLRENGGIEYAIGEMVLNLTDNDLMLDEGSLDENDMDYLEFANEGYNEIHLYAYLQWNVE